MSVNKVTELLKKRRSTAEPTHSPDLVSGDGQTSAKLGPRGPGPKPGSTPIVEMVFRPGETLGDGPIKPKLVVQVAQGTSLDLALPAHLKQRHWGLVYTMLLVVVLPLLVVAGYLYSIAEDQYASTTGFTVRQQEGGSASSFLGGLAGIAGAGGSSDTDILYEFIQSQDIVKRIDAKLDLRAHYSKFWETDKVFSIQPDADIEDLQWFWTRIVRISYDKSASMIEIRVLAFDPNYARSVAQEIVAESQAMINALSATARADSTRYAQADLEEALSRLKMVREQLTSFRTRTRIVDPNADIQARMGVMNNLQQQLAEALISYDLLLENSRPGDPRLEQAAQRTQVIRSRISGERDAFAGGGDDIGAVGDDYPSLISEFERLTVDREYAEETYRAALAALDAARAQAARLSRYLATYIEPTLAQTAEYPRRAILVCLTALFMLLVWAIMALVYYSIRDRR